MTSIRSGIFFIATTLNILAALSLNIQCKAQVYGCRDPLANNYDPAATINNGGCNYNSTAYTPPIKADSLNDILKESSGLQWAGNSLWSFNDGGGAAAIYRIDTITNALLQTVKLAGAENVDWEDIAFDGTNFFIGDFGNNADGARTDLKIYKFPFSAIPDYAGNPIVTIPSAKIEIINFSYSDQPQPPIPTKNNNTTSFDCEAMIVDGGKIHLFTKNWLGPTTTHYEINGLTAGTYIATARETFATNYLVTAASKGYGQNTIALLGYKNGTYNHFMHLLTDYNGGYYFNGNKRQINLPDFLVMGQAEGICFRTATYGYISNEAISFLGIKQKLRCFDISSFISTITSTYMFIGNGNWDTPANWSNNIVPPATVTAGSEIIVDPAPGGQCILNIPYTVPMGGKLTVKTPTNFIVKGNLTVH